MVCVYKANALGCIEDPTLCDITGGICKYNGLCVCKTYYKGNTCSVSTKNSQRFLILKWFKIKYLSMKGT